MLRFLRGDTDHVHGRGEVVAYEMAGSAAVFRDGYKLTKNNPPFGDKQWRLFRPNEDPVEVNDLAQAEPDLLAEMIAAYERFADEFDLIEVPEDYNPILQMQKNVARNQGEEVTDEVPLLD